MDPSKHLRVKLGGGPYPLKHERHDFVDVPLPFLGEIRTHFEGDAVLEIEPEPGGEAPRPAPPAEEGMKGMWSLVPKK
eukprot:12317278-Prorocentrum_lima.AAC.1